MCGYEYTARLQRMLVDMTLSSTLVSEFHDLKIKDDSLSIGFSTLVLQVLIFKPARNYNHELMSSEAKGVSNYIDPGCLILFIQKTYHIRKFVYNYSACDILCTFLLKLFCLVTKELF